MDDIKHKFDEQVESQLAKLIVDGEFEPTKSADGLRIEEFESCISLLDSERQEKDYDWMSDVRLPEFTSQILTQSSLDVGEYYQTREFVEVFIEDEGDKYIKAADCSKRLINRTLNQRHLHHYQKFVRSKVLNHVAGQVYAVCRWDQKLENRVVGHRVVTKQLDVDVYGQPMTDPSAQMPMQQQVLEEVRRDVPLIDRFDYELIDNRCVHTSREYAYTLQEKRWVIIQMEKTLDELKDDAPNAGSFNLDILEEEVKPPENTQTYDVTKPQTQQPVSVQDSLNKPYDVLIRYGKFWCKDKKDGTVEPGIDEYGKPFDSAELRETVIAFAMSDGKKVLIGFDENPYKDADGYSYRPIIRGLCYIHPVKDDGVGDGQYAKELQSAIDDTFNMSQDRVKLATLPTMMVKRTEADNTDSIYVAPGHNMELNDPVTGVRELVIRDNIQGALAQLQILTGKMNQVTSIHPPTMGSMAGVTKTATEVAGAEQHTDIRNHYKAMTFENTFLVELYWQILQMTYQFARPETGMKLMGSKLYDFDPKLDYFYKPLSQSIESEVSKTQKIKMIQNTLMLAIQVQHPSLPKVVNHMLERIYSYMGEEAVNVSKGLFDERQPMTLQGGEGSPKPGDQNVAPPTNQTGAPQNPMEQFARMAQGGMQNRMM